MRVRFAALLVGLSAALLSVVLTGCSLSPTASPAAATGLTIQGNVHGGQQPVVGAHVYVFAANTTAYGAASTSLLSGTGNSDSVGSYVVTSSTGNFTIIAGEYTCTANTQVYIYALGGNPGAGANSAAGFLAALGNCPASGNFATAAPYVWVNEVSTVAAAYAIAGYAVDATHVSSSGTALAATGIANAFANAANLAGISTGAALSATPAGNGTVPQTTIDSIANILTSCVNSTGPASTACTTLFTNAKSAGSTGTTPTDTATAAINIAHNPGKNITALYGLAFPSVAFSPALSAQPNDFTIGINYSGVGSTGAGLNQPYSVAIDALGNAWFTNLGNGFNGTISKLNSSGAPASPSTGYVPGTQFAPNGIAIDLSSNAWVVDGFGFLTEYSSAGALISTAGGYSGGGLAAPQALAIDGSANEWIANFGVSDDVSKFNSSGVAQSTSSGYTGGGIDQSQGIAIDSSNNVWVANRSPGTGSISKFNNSGGPISTSAGYTVGGIDNPAAIAIDSSNNVWVANFSGNSVSELNSTGGAVSASAYTGGGLNQPYAIAIDGLGNVWLANSGGNSVTELTNAGVAISPSTGYTGGTFNGPEGIAVDGAGNVWIANYNSSPTNPVPAVTELIGAAAPVVTPLAQAVNTGKLGTRP